eukprot:TRINITY_DN64142_c0_g3_i1.p1 TRINITY_DN64142_c0_g3~~TRINITY_DN64142_c0_g3_i1.p1  ORF type:complete len:364 (+),score=16.62 TRINITY_DN64142_c0_g3_i1:14-1105(+)
MEYAQSVFLLLSLVQVYCGHIVGISGTKWTINGIPTQKGNHVTEGLLLNARLVQGIFDDANNATRHMWRYPDTGVWDPNRNTREFVGNMSYWHAHGMLGFTIGLQGGCPDCYCSHNPWVVSAFDDKTGDIKPAWFSRLSLIMQRADELGMVPIVQYFYGSQFGKFGPKHKESVINNALTQATQWLVASKHKNFLIEVYNERCDDYIAGLIDQVHSVALKAGRKVLVSSSCSGGKLPSTKLVQSADFILLHGNGQTPTSITHMLNTMRNKPAYKHNPKPIVFNEDDHGNFQSMDSNLMHAVHGGASWGFLCCCSAKSQGDYWKGYQCPPVDWSGSRGTCKVNGGTHADKPEWFAAVANLTKLGF